MSRHTGPLRLRSPNKPLLALDFDGVLHSYRRPYEGPTVVADGPTPGAMEFVQRAQREFRVAVFSGRSHHMGGIEAMADWLTGHMRAAVEDKALAADIVGAIEWPMEKPPARVFLDDRALTFTGKWPTVDGLLRFQPWNRRTKKI